MPRAKQGKNTGGQRNAGKQSEGRGKRASEPNSEMMGSTGRKTTTSRGQKNRGRG